VRLALLLLFVAACTAETSKQCRRVCARQGECESVAAAEGGSDTAFDEGECVAACAALERDPNTAGLVSSHVECVDKAGTGSAACPAVLECR
jgi:hypothetical protein